MTIINVTINVVATASPPPPPPGPPPPPPTSVSFTTSEVLSTAVRNDYTGFVGMQVTIGVKYLSVSSLGRWIVAGNTQTHLVKIVDTSTGLDVGSVTINTSGATPGEFAYAALSSPVTLVPGITYFIVSQETSGGDTWHDNGTTATTTSDASLAGSVAGGLTTPAENWSTGSTASQEYGPVDFLYYYRSQPALQPGFTPIAEWSQIIAAGNYQLVKDIPGPVVTLDVSNVVVDGGEFQINGTLIINSSQSSSAIQIRNLRSYAAILYGDTSIRQNTTPVVSYRNSVVASPPNVGYGFAIYGNNIVVSNNILAGRSTTTDDDVATYNLGTTTSQQWVTISNNIITRCFDAGVEGVCPQWKNVTITGNTISSASFVAIGSWFVDMSHAWNTPPTVCIFTNNTVSAATVPHLFAFTNGPGGSLVYLNDDATANSLWPGNTFSGNTLTTSRHEDYTASTIG